MIDLLPIDRVMVSWMINGHGVTKLDVSAIRMKINSFERRQ